MAHGRMQDAAVRAENMPIGSGDIEAACKHVVKQRDAISGARWKRQDLQTALSLCSLRIPTGLSHFGSNGPG